MWKRSAKKTEKDSQVILKKSIKAEEPEGRKPEASALSRAYSKFSIVNKVSRDLTLINDLSVLLEEVVNLVMPVLRADRILIMLLEHDTGKLIPRITRSRKGQKELTVGDISSSVLDEVMNTESALFVRDTGLSEKFSAKASIISHGIKSALCVPLKVKERTLGLMYLDALGPRASFKDEDLSLLISLANQIAVCIENARLFSELKAKQELLVQSEKMAAVGVLASGIAHEIKNPLGIIIQAIDCLERELAAGKTDQAAVLEMIREATARADKIVRGVLNFSRTNPQELTAHDINNLIQVSLDLVARELREKEIRVERELAAGLPQACVDSNQIEQVLVNLIINAVQALPVGGSLFLRTYTKELRELRDGIGRKAEDFFKIGDQLVVCEIEDNGPGVSPEHMKRVFDPFYTTRAPGEGTGLGLAISRSIIDNHRGLINMKSDLGKGSKITISLPIKRLRAGS